ncbi:MAG TPA: EamA family transporter [Terracidiphilus sp.]|jgi:drug/metabolite transporter (DMT)-like permease
MTTDPQPARWKTLLAFAIIYFIWGSTFFAIRVGVSEIPPFLLCAMRFLAAGALVYGWAAAQGEHSPNARQWSSVLMMALLIFVGDYGLLFWAEQRVPSGIAAVIMATIPVFMALSEILILRTQRLTLRLAAALLAGIMGVAVLTSRSFIFGNLAGASIDTAGTVALICGAVCWSVASALSRKLPLPESKVMSSGAQMLAGGVMLAAVAAARGEWHGFHAQQVSGGAWIALLYLVFAGSIAGFTAYVWLLHHQSPTKVGTYAYVNPVVAVLLGYWLGGEPIGARAVVGGMFILASVVAITRMRAKTPTVAEKSAR